MKRVFGQCTPTAIRELIQFIGDEKIKSGDDIREADLPQSVKCALPVLVHMMKVNNNDLDKVLKDLWRVKHIIIWERDDKSYVLEFRFYPVKGATR